MPLERLPMELLLELATAAHCRLACLMKVEDMQREREELGTGFHYKLVLHLEGEDTLG